MYMYTRYHTDYSFYYKQLPLTIMCTMCTCTCTCIPNNDYTSQYLGDVLVININGRWITTILILLISWECQCVSSGKLYFCTATLYNRAYMITNNNRGHSILTPFSKPVRISGPLVSKAIATYLSETCSLALRTFSMVALWY